MMPDDALRSQWTALSVTESTRVLYFLGMATRVCSNLLVGIGAFVSGCWLGIKRYEP